METIYTRVTAAKQIRKELKVKFPAIKFSVTSESYSGGDSIDIRWSLGPTKKAVEAITSKYQEGSFDGMTDCYDYDSTLVMTADNQLKKLGGAKYVFATRETSSIIENVCQELCKLQGIEYQGQYTKFYNTGHESVGEIAYRVISKSDLTSGYHGVKRSDRKAGLSEDMYEIY